MRTRAQCKHTNEHHNRTPLELGMCVFEGREESGREREIVIVKRIKPILVFLGESVYATVNNSKSFTAAKQNAQKTKNL